MAYYLVDYENVKADGMYGVDQLGKKDCVCIFYSENASTLTFGLHEKLNQTKGKIVLQKVEVGVKNALDFQLSTYLGYLISENEGKNESYYIVSEEIPWKKTAEEGKCTSGADNKTAGTHKKTGNKITESGAAETGCGKHRDSGGRKGADRRKTGTAGKRSCSPSGE